VGIIVDGVVLGWVFIGEVWFSIVMVILPMPDIYILSATDMI
jgi:hypothetical protein